MQNDTSQVFFGGGKVRSTFDNCNDVDPGESADIRQLVSWFHCLRVYRKIDCRLVEAQQVCSLNLQPGRAEQGDKETITLSYHGNIP